MQRIVDLLAGKGLVRFEPNPHHQRAKPVVLTPAGIAVEGAAKDRQRPLAHELTVALIPERPKATLEVLTQMDLHLAQVTGATDEELDKKEALT